MYVYVHVSACVYVCDIQTVSTEVRKGCQISWNWRTLIIRELGIKCGSIRAAVALTAELALQLLRYNA